MRTTKQNRLPVPGANGHAAKIERIPLITSGDFASADYAVSYLIPGVLVAGEPCVVGGPIKSLKTSQLVDLAVSLATGTPWLNHFPVARKAKVSILSGESGPGTLQAAAKAICEARGVELAECSILWSFTVPKLPRNIAQLEATIKDAGIEVLIVDPVYQAIGEAVGGSAGNLLKVGPILGEIGDMGQRLGLTIILAHHLRKASGKGSTVPTLEDLTQSGFPEWARQWLLIGRRKAYQSDGVHELVISIGGSAGHSSQHNLTIRERDDQGRRTWAVNVHAEKDSGIDPEARQSILRYLAANPKGDTFAAIRDESDAKLGTNALHAFLNAMEDDGLIEPCKVRKGRGRGALRDAYRLTAKGLEEAET